MKTQTQELLSCGNAGCLLDSGKGTCAWQKFCQSVTDEDVVEQVKRNKECFACLVERYDGKIKAYIRRIAGASNETAEDIAQEVFFKVYANLHKFDRTMKFSSWIYRIAHNQAVNKYLYEKRRKTESIIWDETGELKSTVKDKHNVWEEVQQEDINEKLIDALDNVSEKYKNIIELNYFHDKSYQEIAAELDKPIGTVGTMLNRGKKMLKRELAIMGVTYEEVLV